jgi:hypothetical protein
MSKSIYDAFETDPKKEVDGVVFDYGEVGSFLLARAGGANKKFSKQLEFRSRPYKRQIDKGTMDNEAATKLMAQVFADTVILGWDGVIDREGNLIEFTKENCVKLLLDLPVVFADLQDAAADYSSYRKEMLEEDSKN